MGELSVQNEDGTTTIDFETLKETYKLLGEVKKSLSTQAKEAAAKKNKESKEAAIKSGKEYATANIAVGDKISWTMADGSIKTGTVFNFNEKAIRVIRDDTNGYKPSADGKYYANVSYDKLVIASAEEVA